MENRIKSELSWKRPENVPYPKVWRTFEAISKTTGRKHKIKIQDITRDRFEETIVFMATNFDHHEPLSKATESWNDSESVTASRILSRKFLEQKISLMAVINEDNTNSKSEIIGILMLFVKLKNDPPTKVRNGLIIANVQPIGKKLIKVFGFLDFAMNGVDPFQLLESDRYVCHMGVSVAPKYYGLGVGLELELQSSVVGKACGIKGSCIIFTSSYSQLIGEKLGCTMVKEVRFDDYKDENGEVIIPNLDGLTAKVAIWKYA